MSLSVRMLSETLRTLAFGGITGVYAPLGTPFANPISICIFQNQTTQLVYLSLDGVNDNIALPAGGYILLDLTTNRGSDEGIYFAQGTQIYVRAPGALPTTNGVSLAAFYGSKVGV
jgi:hypothetical protein